jgi:tRNA A-37 threonylcarbamoyl transferase component Bud32|uniref:protein kinase domain-containing protein n=1 Tax=Prosthecobacter sp. TaxID=1965333 RepID=UPI003783A9AF
MPPSNSSISRQKEIFLAAREISDAGERARFITEACGGDFALRGRIETMLGAEGEKNGFLEPNETLTASVPIPAAGDKVGYFGDYVLLDEIAHGSSGVVFRARQVSLDRVVALKMLRHRPLLSKEADTQRLRAEATAAASLDHPNIVPIYEVGAHEGQPYFSMKLVAGGTLQFHMAEYQAAPRKAVALMVKVARAVQHAHAKGILHRDLKPGNILLDAVGEPHVTDFGLARKMGQESGLTMTGVVGTPHYMSPEQARGGVRELTPATDIYSLGAILYELVEGHHAFESDDLIELLKQVAEKPPPTPRTPHRELAAILMKCLEKSPAARHATAAELADALENWLRVDPVVTRRPVLRKAWKPALAAAAMILLAIGVKVLWDGRQGTEMHETLTLVHTFAGHRYQFVPGAMGWTEAKAKAETMGGHLATITSKEECKWIYATFRTQLDAAHRSSSIWLGASAAASGQPFTWITGEPFTFTDWPEGEPDYSSTMGQPVPGPFGIVIKHHGRLCWFDDPVRRKNASAGLLVEWDK